ncbi:calmodulin-binding transcription activator 5-like isoform X2 [Cornus florida]|uniref:calmodulin-binding transcription activator 5-like isoform X2 n=1 Tax=Cornus florida TaxID=4283 RepID=UPI00289F776A|nr:calmodulin-binding transcription activator 5-like isoform X2 [Cornus florida]XP_059646865.1 calmodulin-binding transcription activator 5-like isoform X2 [Cornus florida]XP_059646873.1 calmodulin-binding transcription activator 5-like isoform X2 [Cornus florida]
MERIVEGRLVGSEIHGFHTMEDLDVGTMMEEAKARWLRPNEIHAILCNFKYFSINVKPLNLPKSGKIVLFDRKMLRNFRKDGHNWKKKKDGKTVKEAHEHLKVGNEERIHVYYAHGQDNPTFVRRCYWLLDKTLEHIVLVHYRETQEGSPVTPVNSSSSSGLSDPSASWLLSEETDSGTNQVYSTEPGDSITIKIHERRLHEINTLEWEDLLVPDDPSKLNTSEGGGEQGNASCFEQQNQYEINGCKSKGNLPSTCNLPAENSTFLNLPRSAPGSNYLHFNTSGSHCTGNSIKMMDNDGLQTQDSFGRWMNQVIADSPGSVDDPNSESSLSPGYESFTTPMIKHQPSVPELIFSITDVSPAWAFSTEETKIMVIGQFYEGYPDLRKSNLFCVCGDAFAPAEIVQPGVFRCLVSPHTPGPVNLYLSFDGRKPISQVMTFEYRVPFLQNQMGSSEDKSKWEEFQVQMRLARLLFSTSNSLKILSSKVSQNSLQQAKVFARRSSQIFDSWANMIKSIENKKIPFPQAKDSLFELSLKSKLQEWLLERVIDGCKTSDHDDHGQGVIHLCAILGYTWAVYSYSWSGLSIDYRDKFGWTALHWAAYCGRKEMVAALLSAGAKPNLVTDPTKENPGGCNAADLASKNGFDGLAAYLAEKALVQHFEDMTIAGNVSGSLQTSTTNSVEPGNLSEDDLYLKDTLTAYRTAVDAAARIHAAFREHSFKLREKEVQFSNPEDEAQAIVAAMKIQHAFRNFETRKKMAAAAQIQHRFRTWKIRKKFLNMRRQAIKIQAVFRGYQVRKQYRKIIWAFGVLEKAILRWRLKRKGFRGIQAPPVEDVKDQKQESDVEEGFFCASRKQAEERIERSVVKVQAMFRSKVAQQEYQKMKLAHNQAMLEYEGLLNPETDMG